jgi:hypothetical protein
MIGAAYPAMTTLRVARMIFGVGHITMASISAEIPLPVPSV